MSNFSRSQIVRKTVTRSSGGVVAAQHRKAAQVGARVLAEGGNAIDAAVATSFAIGVVEPWMSGPGGGGYMVVRRPGEDVASVVEFPMRSPTGLDPADYPLSGGVAGDLFPWPAVVEDRNVLGATAIAVPGLVAGMATALETFGTKPWGDLLAPAAALAKEGLLVDWYAQLVISGAAPQLARFPASRAMFLDAEGFPKASAWTALASLRCDQSAMAATLRRLAAAGPEDFYEGETAASVVADVQAAGGRLSAADLAGYRARVVPAHVVGHDRGRLFVTPEMTAGPTLDHAWRHWAGRISGAASPAADDYIAYAETLFSAYAERLTRMGDVEGGRGVADREPTCTTHFNVVDRDGMMVSVTQTLLSIFGSRLVLPQSGLLMNNGIMWFDPEPGRPNSLAPDKTCLTNMTPLLGEREDGLHFALGASGGRKILPAVAELASFLLDFGMDLETAFHAPRIDVSGGDTVVADDTLPAEVLEALSARYRTIAAPRTVYPYNFACPSAVARRGGETSGITEPYSPWGDAVAGE